MTNRDEARRRALESLSAITGEEDAAIDAGIAADPDTEELTREWFEKARRAAGLETR